MTAANGGERKPNGRKAASVETSLTAFHFILTGERGRTGKRANLDKANGHIKRTWGMRPGISGHAKRHEDGAGGQGETGNMQERLRG